MSQEVRVRYAPSPTGHLHIGNARTALFNYLFAKHYQGKLIIRIEDTDVKRNIAGGVESQLKYLKWLGITWDESVDCGGPYGPYYQTERIEIYQKYIEQLIQEGKAYYCYCTEEELEAEREQQMSQGETPKYSGKHRILTEEQKRAYEAMGRKPSVRFKVPEEQSYQFDDIVKGSISFSSAETGDFVILKKDGIPTYNFAVVVDDYLMKITHVLRGEDHITNTLRQLMIYEALNWQVPIFGHMTLIVNENRKKLSKRDESVIQFIEQYDALGYLPEALFNFIALLGWSPGKEEEVFTPDELISLFDEKRLSHSPALFDMQKLNWLSNLYIKKADVERITQMAIPYLEKAYRTDLSTKYQWTKELVSLYQEQLNCVSEIVSLTEIFFKACENHDMEVLQQPHVSSMLKVFLDKLEQSELWTASVIKQLIQETQKDTGQKGKNLFMPIRVAITGQKHGRDLNETLALLGKERCKAELNKTIELI